MEVEYRCSLTYLAVERSVSLPRRPIELISTVPRALTCHDRGSHADNEIDNAQLEQGRLRSIMLREGIVS
jgi:hypothetical protein